jgi:hypothetical protein
MSKVTINFVAPKHFDRWLDIDQLNANEISQYQIRFRSGVDVWVVQTYLLMRDTLRQANIQVRFVREFVPGEIAVCHRDDLNSFIGPHHNAYVVVVRADRPPVVAGQHCVTQFKT